MHQFTTFHRSGGGICNEGEGKDMMRLALELQEINTLVIVSKELF